MKVLLLADINSEHTRKWALGLADSGIETGVYSLNKADHDWFSSHAFITVLAQAADRLSGSSLMEKIRYLKMGRQVRKAIKDFQPDIVHAHYASSYGLLGALSGFHPFILSVWGADVFDFPKQSAVQRHILLHNFRKADKILSTSHVMRDEISLYTSKEVVITPFGVDTEAFSPGKVNEFFTEKDIVVGTVKAIERKYGPDVLVRSFARAREMAPQLPLKLLLVGTGSLESKMKELTTELNIFDHVIFTGRIPHEKVPHYHRMIDVFVSASVDDSESFGVSAVEACACEKAVIVSRIGGLKEVVLDNETGLIVPPNDIDELAKAIVRFASDENLRAEFGKRARAHVIRNYSWPVSLDTMIGVYRNVLRERESL